VGITESLTTASGLPAPISGVVLNKILNRHKRQAQGQGQGNHVHSQHTGHSGQRKHSHVTGKPGSATTDNEAKGQRSKQASGHSAHNVHSNARRKASSQKRKLMQSPHSSHGTGSASHTKALK